MEGSSTATSLDFQSILNMLSLRSVVSSSDGYRRVQVRPDVSGDVSRKYFYVRDVRVYTNDAPISGGLPALSVREGVSTTFQVAAFTDEEDDAVGKDLTYGAQLVVGGTLGALPLWIDFVEDDADFYVFPPCGFGFGGIYASGFGAGLGWFYDHWGFHAHGFGCGAERHSASEHSGRPGPCAGGYVLHLCVFQVPGQGGRCGEQGPHI